MEPNNLTMGDRPTSDVIVRIRTITRDEWIYCHSKIVSSKSNYIAHVLSEAPLREILDLRDCVNVSCNDEAEFDSYITILRHFYNPSELFNSVKNAISVLQTAHKLGCPDIITSCIEFIEAVPWEEAEEEEVLEKLPMLVPQIPELEKILARIKPPNPLTILKLFRSAMNFATSSPPLSMRDFKISAQEQLEYMLSEDDDAPLIIADTQIKSATIILMKKLFTRFQELLNSLVSDLEESITDPSKMEFFLLYIEDLSWSCQILTKMESLTFFAENWVEVSSSVIKVVDYNANPDIMIKAIEVTAKIFEAIVYGSIILGTEKRVHIVKTWLPFLRVMKPIMGTGEDEEFWRSLESAIITTILTFSLDDQAGILTVWLADGEQIHIRYPDLTEVFENWCIRSKGAKRNLSVVNGTVNMV